jgi:long-chain acyl-CoA synthetase
MTTEPAAAAPPDTAAAPPDTKDPKVEYRKQLARSGLTLRFWAEETPARAAIISDFGSRSFADLDAAANQLVRALRARGLAAGASVALICTNRPEFAEVAAACLRGGYRLTPINWHLTSEEAAYIVGDCEAKAVIADARLSDTAAAAVTKSGGVSVKLAVGGAVDGFDPYEAALAAEPGELIDDPSAGSHMLYTSGTTGRPKGVYRPPGAATPATANIYGYKEYGSDMHLCTGPLYHAAPLAFSLSAPLAVGCGVVLMDQWDAEETLRLIQLHSITHTHMVPTMFHRLLSLPEDVRAKYDTSSLRYVLHGAAPCPIPVKQRIIQWFGPIVWEYYAATEGAGSFVDSATWLKKPGTVGRPLVEGQMVVGDGLGAEVPRGEIGLVYLRAPESARFEYFKDREKTEESYRGDYFTLGDVGYMDEDGYLFLTDRSANLIISGGVNIYPAEVDAVLLQHPAVGDVATIGVPNEEWGEEVKAVVELQPGRAGTPELARELIEFCRAHLAPFKCPRSVDFIDKLPRQDNGKIYKRVLRQRYRTGTAPS